MKGQTGKKVKLNPFFYLGDRWGRWSRPGKIFFTTGKENYALCTRGWVGTRDGLDGGREFHTQRDSISIPSSPQTNKTPTTLCRPENKYDYYYYYYYPWECLQKNTFRFI